MTELSRSLKSTRFNLLVRFSVVPLKEKNVCCVLFAFRQIESHFEKGSTLKENNLLQRGEYTFYLE